MDEKNFKIVFDNKKLKNMIAPLFLEQFLLLAVGIADTLVISYVNEAAVSGVSLVEQFNVVLIYLFTALSAGGAVVISQYIGRNEKKLASESASQLLFFSIIFSILLSIFISIFHREILNFLFGRVEIDVMGACEKYLKISALSYPALAIYNAGAAVYRSMGKTKITMYISIAANFLNVAGNLIGVFVLKAGIFGVAFPSLISRIFSAILITYFCFGEKNFVRYEFEKILQFNRELLKKILKIAVPNGIESGIFQLVKVALLSIVALFGTYQIAANGVAQSIWSVTSMCTTVMGIIFITVIGQCMGAKDIFAAEFYFKKLMKITVAMSSAWNFLTFLITPIFLEFYALADETKNLIIFLVLLHNTFSAIIFPFAGALGNGLRATGDVKFTMTVAILSTVGGSFICAYIFGIIFNFGVMGVAMAMCLDWVIRAIFYIIRQKSGEWKNFQVI